MAESNVYACPECPRTFSSQNGLAGHIGSAHREPPAKKPGVPDRGTFKCPECPKVYHYARALGKHRSLAHGVPGKSVSAIAMRNKKQNTQPMSSESPHAPHKRQAENGHIPALDPVVYGIAVGSVQEFCRNFAEEHDLPARVFTRQFAELFLRQARR